MIWLKLAHIAAFAIWSACLICLPALFVQRAHVRGRRSLQGLQVLVRFVYVRILSPAAFAAIATGTALIFVRGTFEAWFSLKLAMVALMTVAHVLTGLVIIRLFEAGQIYPLWRFAAATGLTLCVVLAILIVVLAKPELPDLLPAAMGEPGALRRIILDLIPFPRS
ncbi:MAG: CopD family protein [Rhodospirillales bacterium]